MTERTREERLAVLREARVVLVSACLLGEACRYDGKSKGSDRVIAGAGGQGSGARVPGDGRGAGHPAARGGAARRHGRSGAGRTGPGGGGATGEDRTAAFRYGAELALEAARRFGATVAVLKERSPSCGTQGTHVDGAVVPGRGVTAALLHSAGITVLSDEEL